MSVPAQQETGETGRSKRPVRGWVIGLAVAVVVVAVAILVGMISARTASSPDIGPTGMAPEPAGTPPDPVATVSSPDSGQVFGVITCTPDIQGVWVGSNSGGQSGWAQTSRIAPDKVAYSLNVPPSTWIQLTVGCGGSPASIRYLARAGWFVPSKAAYNLDCNGPQSTCQIDFATK